MRDTKRRLRAVNVSTRVAEAQNDERGVRKRNETLKRKSGGEKDKSDDPERDLRESVANLTDDPLRNEREHIVEKIKSPKIKICSDKFSEDEKTNDFRNEMNVKIQKADADAGDLSLQNAFSPSPSFSLLIIPYYRGKVNLGARGKRLIDIPSAAVVSLFQK